MLPLVDITNTQDSDPANRKRTLDAFLKPRDGEVLCYPVPPRVDQLSEHPSNSKDTPALPVFQSKTNVEGEEENGTSLIPADRDGCSPAKSDPGLTVSGSSPLDANSPSPNVTPKGKPVQYATHLSTLTSPAKPMSTLSTAEPPVKKRKVTPEEKATKALLSEAKKQEKEAAKAKAEEEKRQKAVEREKEREKKRREKELADKLKAEQKAQKAAEKAQKEAEKAAEKAQKEAEKEKKMANQKKISDMFGKGATAVKKQPPVIKAEQPDESSSNPLTEAVFTYEQRFKPFFLKEGVTLASNPYEMDEETRETKTKILEAYINGERTLDPLPLREHIRGALQSPFSDRLGRVYPSVKKIMAEYDGQSAAKPVDLTTESQNAQISHIREALKAVPVKSLKFREDVRPPYVGTISGLPPGVKSIRQIAIRPTSRIVPVLNYDYDSEAEWQDEDGEDVEDLDDEDDDLDNDEDMDDFLDDSEDVGPARLVFSGGMEPESTGLCWENAERQNSPAKMLEHRMEVILGKHAMMLSKRGAAWLTRFTECLPSDGEINPFSVSYWQPARVSKAPTVPEATMSKSASVSPKPAPNSRANPMAPPPAPSDAFQLLTRKPGPKKASQPLPSELLVKFKELIRSKPNTSKIGLIEWFAGEHPDCPRAQIKLTWDLLTEKADRAGRGTTWKLKDNI